MSSITKSKGPSSLLQTTPKGKTAADSAKARFFYQGIFALKRLQFRQPAKEIKKTVPSRK
jgi:hypothetical protein